MPASTLKTLAKRPFLALKLIPLIGGVLAAPFEISEYKRADSMAEKHRLLTKATATRSPYWQAVQNRASGTPLHAGQPYQPVVAQRANAPATVTRPLEHYFGQNPLSQSPALKRVKTASDHAKDAVHQLGGKLREHRHFAYARQHFKPGHAH